MTLGIVIASVAGILTITIVAELSHGKRRLHLFSAAFFCLMVFLVFVGVDIYQAEGQREEDIFITELSLTCGSISARKSEVHRVRRFCDKFMAGTGSQGVVSAYSNDMILVIKATPDFAYGFLEDRLLAERIMRKWLDGWKDISGHELAKITVKLDDIDLITADATVFSGDKVEFHR